MGSGNVNGPAQGLRIDQVANDRDVFTRPFADVPVGIFLDGHFPLVDRFAVNLRLGEHDGDVVVGQRAIGVVCEGRLELSQRLLGTSFPQMQRTQIAAGLLVGGIQLQGAPVERLGLGDSFIANLPAGLLFGAVVPQGPQVHHRFDEGAVLGHRQGEVGLGAVQTGDHEGIPQPAIMALSPAAW